MVGAYSFDPSGKSPDAQGIGEKSFPINLIIYSYLTAILLIIKLRLRYANPPSLYDKQKLGRS